ncbi:hypothetical protein FH972_021241 [Carpinus fangiana]|uniref:Presequence protease, mitochondrial n=1 Tax=Carpinus fangiana TaxID=176857 RepID=A0A5N6KP58_9ROSI|nr:hypothetical protein FH972_021241 [Carpinus fangiana]
MIPARQQATRKAVSNLLHHKALPVHRSYAAVAEAASSLQPGESVHGFTLQRKKHVPELELTALHFQHDKTGGQYLHLAKDDKNNVFSIGFKTNPPNHTGVPHILEHTTLCGSEKYPVRDPFFKMMPRSLNNFMNAMTYPDHTIYPFATTNHQDFKNLMSVYMDATLHPLLKESDFTQEGWRLGPENPLEPASDSNPIQFKGVVYNEMKGQMSSADYLFHMRWQNHIFPSIKDSGGDPQKMTDLTHAQLTQFHADHYNPSNAKILTYGDMPVKEHLKQLADQLDSFGQSHVDSQLMAPTTLSNGPQTVTVKGPADPLYPRDEQYKASVSWIMNDTSDVLETFSLDMISSLLLEGFSAPLYQNTIEIGWGASYSPNTGYDSSAKVGIFSVGLSGLKKQHLVGFRDGLKNTFLSVRRRGFDPDKIEGRLHQIELSLKHKTAQFGMGITNRLQDAWFNGVDPFNSVAPQEVLTAFREKIQDPDYLSGLFEKYWLNDDTFTFIMEPSESFGDELLAEEASRLKTKIDEVNSRFDSPEEATKHLEQKESELLKEQESAQGADVSCLPTVRVSDIPRAIERKEIRRTSHSDTKVQWREAPTNGLTYFRAIQTFKDLPDELRIYLPLFSSAIQRIGTQSMSVEALEDTLRLRTGGIGLSHHSSTSPTNIDKSEDGIMLSATALDRNVPHMFELLRTIIQETDFDKRDASEKLGELIKSSASTAINDVADSGHAYARRFAEAGLSEDARLSEEVSGMTQVRLMMDLAGRVQHGLPDVIEKLKAIQSFILSGTSSLRVAMTCGSEASGANEQALEDFLSRLPPDALAPQAPEQMPYPRDAKSFFPLPYQVYYTGLAMRTVPYTDPASPALAILAQLLTHKRLHPEVREKGGAYGASAYSRGLRGTFGFATYRDPNPLNSLRVMREAGAWAAGREWSAREIDEAKLSVFQALDAPESVSDEGMARFLTGVSDEMRQERRERMLDVAAGDVQDVAARFVAGAEETNTAVLGAKKEAFEPAQGWIEMPMAGGEGPVVGGSGEGEDGPPRAHLSSGGSVMQEVRLRLHLELPSIEAGSRAEASGAVGLILRGQVP